MIHLIFSFVFAFDAGVFVSSVQNHKVSCENCPPSVVTVVAMSYGRSFCRGALIDEKRVITNAHCVEDVVEQCATHVVVKIGDDVVACEKVEYFSIVAEDINYPDIAVIRLKESVSAVPATLSFSAFSDKQELYYYKSDMDFSTNSSAMKKVVCKTKKYSAIGGFYSERPQVVSLTDCPFDEGDSGSPIFNSDGEVVALLHGGLSKDALRIFTRIQLPHYNRKSYTDLLSANFNFSDSDNIEFHPIITATTITCVDYLGGKPCDDKSFLDYSRDELIKIMKAFNQSLAEENQKSLVVWEALTLEQFEQLFVSKQILESSQADFSNEIAAKIKCRRTDIGMAQQPVLHIITSVDRNFRYYYEGEYKTHPMDVTNVEVCKDGE